MYRKTKPTNKLLICHERQAVCIASASDCHSCALDVVLLDKSPSLQSSIQHMANERPNNTNIWTAGQGRKKHFLLPFKHVQKQERGIPRALRSG